MDHCWKMALVALALMSAEPLVRALAESVEPETVQVLDGDTVRVAGRSIRLIDFDAPETGARSRCDAERQLGAQASERLREIVRAGTLDLELVPCQCRHGTEGTKACNYGRACGVLRANGQDIGSILIRDGLARSYVCSNGRCPKRRGWCS